LFYPFKFHFFKIPMQHDSLLLLLLVENLTVEQISREGTVQSNCFFSMMLFSTDQEDEAATVVAKANAATTAAPSSSNSLLSDLAVQRPSRWSVATTAAAPNWSLNSSASSRRRPHPETPQMLTLGRFERSTDEYEINHQQSYYQQQQPHSPPPTHRQRMIDNNTHRTRNVPDNVTDDDTDNIMMRRHANASLVESEDGAVAILHNHNNRPESSWWQRPSRFWNARSSTQHKETLMESATESASTTTTEHVFHLVKNAIQSLASQESASDQRSVAVVANANALGCCG
jgi:hypothetical protein